MIDGRNETDFVRDVLVALGATGRVVVWRNNAGTAVLGKGRGVIRVGTPGMSDILGFTIGEPTRFVAIELKSPTARWTKAQLVFLARVRQCGHVAVRYRYNVDLGWNDNVSEVSAMTLAMIDRSPHGADSRDGDARCDEGDRQ